ncbi:unnamed protein product [Ixodes pacificus]
MHIFAQLVTENVLYIVLFVYSKILQVIVSAQFLQCLAFTFPLPRAVCHFNYRICHSENPLKCSM